MYKLSKDGSDSMIFILYIRKLSPTMLVWFARDLFSGGVGAMAQDFLVWCSLCGVGISTKANESFRHPRGCPGTTSGSEKRWKALARAGFLSDVRLEYLRGKPADITFIVHGMGIVPI